MINSRDILELHPIVRDKADALIKLCDQAGIDLLITSTYRDGECQDSLYAQGRTKPGKIVTNARAGQSWHNWKCAFDVVPLRNGKPIWDSADSVWKEIGAIGESLGLEWAGRWSGKLKETAHFQYTGGLTLADLQSGKALA